MAESRVLRGVLFLPKRDEILIIGSCKKIV
jgi:hypothetical protein